MPEDLDPDVSRWVLICLCAIHVKGGSFCGSASQQGEHTQHQTVKVKPRDSGRQSRERKNREENGTRLHERRGGEGKQH